jgi:hypothetical protein
MQVKLTLICDVICHNGSMKIEIYDQHACIYTGENLTEGPLKIDCMIDWPTTVNITLSNKGKTDTLTDETGEIIKDKAIEVTEVLINNFPIHQDLIDKLFICRREGSDVDTNENWWSFNGTVKILFDQLNPMRYMLSLRNEFNINRNHWNNNDK